MASTRQSVRTLERHHHQPALQHGQQISGAAAAAIDSTFCSGQSGVMTCSTVDDDPSANVRLTGKNLKIAMELKEDSAEKSRMLQTLIYTDPNNAGVRTKKKKRYSISSMKKHCFFSHRGPDTKKPLVEPLQRTLKAFYDIEAFVDSLPIGEYSNDDKVDILRRTLWSCAKMVIFLSPKFHKSKWALKELYTAIYRARVDPTFVYTIVYCGGMDPRQCEALEAYAGLDLGRSWGTLQTWDLPFADLVMRHVHELVVRLVLGDAASIKDDFVVRARFESECTVCEPIFQHGVPAPLPYFEGREGEIQKLSHMLHSQRAAVIFPIGVGGVGKSQLVVEWVDQNRLHYDIIAWVRAENNDTLCQDLARLAEALGMTIGPDDSMDHIAKLVVDNLSNRTTSRPNVLLVYDNAESYSDIKLWLPGRGSSCHTIVTTRNSRGCSPSSTIGVGPLDKDSAYRVIEHLIARQLTNQELPEVTTILKLFGYLPLAIVLFAQLIRVEGVKDAVAMVRDQTEKVLESDIELDRAYGGKGRQSVWSVCRTQVKGVSEVALRLLFCLSVLDADNVPKQLLKHFITNPLDLSEATRELASRSLVQVRSEDGSVSTHRLIQLNTRDFIDTNANTRTELMESIGAAVLQAVRDVDFRLGRRNKIVTDILPHLKALNHHWVVYDDSSATLGRLKFYLGTIYHNDARYDLALVEYRESLRIERAAYGNEDPDVAATLHHMGHVYYLQGQYERALEKYRESLRMKQAAYGNEHPEVAATSHSMGNVYSEQGHYERALEEYRVTLRIQQAAYGNEHPKVAVTLHSMGGVYHDQGHCERALVEYRESLRIAQAAYGNEHPSIAATLHNMGNVYSDQGHIERALEEYRESLRIKQAAYGSEHPTIAITLHNMGNVYSEQGHYERALEVYRESLRIKQAVYGNEHPRVAATLRSMGDVHERQGQYEDALDEYRESLRIQQAAYGNEHPRVAITLHDVGRVYQEEGHDDRALDVFREAVRMHRLFFETGHPHQEVMVESIAALSERNSKAPNEGRALEG
jgi:tetratricopeptide (TPR) repeat protein